MKKEILLSIIIPVYNSETYLEESLESVVNQTYSNIEIILIDDGSSDSSPEICRSYARKDDRVVFIRQENLGVAAARNHGLRIARGDLVIFVDSDDLLARHTCEYVCREMGDYDLMFLEHQLFYSTSQICDIQSALDVAGVDLCRYGRRDWICSQLGPTKTVPEKLGLHTVWAKAYRRAFIAEHHIEFPQGVAIGEDMLFNLEIFQKDPRICSLAVNSYFYRRHPESVAQGYSPDYQVCDLKFSEVLENILSQEEFREEIQKGIAHQKIGGFFQILVRDIFHRDNPKCEKDKRKDYLRLVNQREYRALFLSQMSHLKPAKICVLIFAAMRMYFPVKCMYLIKNTKS